MMLRLGLSPAPTSQTLCHLLSQAACLMGKEQLEEPYHQACDCSRGMVWRWEFVWYFEVHSDASLMAFLPGWRMWWGWGTEVMSQINERWKGVWASAFLCASYQQFISSHPQPHFPNTGSQNNVMRIRIEWRRVPRRAVLGTRWQQQQVPSGPVTSLEHLGHSGAAVGGDATSTPPLSVYDAPQTSLTWGLGQELGVGHCADSG